MSMLYSDIINKIDEEILSISVSYIINEESYEYNEIDYMNSDLAKNIIKDLTEAKTKMQEAYNKTKEIM